MKKEHGQAMGIRQHQAMARGETVNKESEVEESSKPTARDTYKKGGHVGRAHKSSARHNY